MGRRRRRSPDDLDAVLVVDKPAGPTSHDVVQIVRRAAGQHRVGHTGTLDPPATGVLVVCLGRAAKLVQFLQRGTKTYAAQMVLGVVTSTQDADGEVLATTSADTLDEQRVCEALTRFQGPLQQIPPMVSAVKVGGERLHEAARRGEEIEREARPVIVHDLILDAYDAADPAHPRVSFLVTCSSGTYVRTLAHDIGAALGVGASLTSLRRLANGPFGVDEAVPVERIRSAGEDGTFATLLLSPEEAVARALPRIEVDDAEVAMALAQGKPALAAQGRTGPYAVFGGPRLLGIYLDRGERARPELVWTRPEELRGAAEGADGAPSAPRTDDTGPGADTGAET